MYIIIYYIYTCMCIILKKMSGSVMNHLTRQERYSGEQEVSRNFTTQQQKLEVFICSYMLHRQEEVDKSK